MLLVTDNNTNEYPAFDLAQSLKMEEVLLTFEPLRISCWLPKVIKIDYGGEFIPQTIDERAYEREVELDFSQL